MRRIARWIVVAALTFTVGLACVLLPGVVSQLRGLNEEPVVAAPPMAVNDDLKKCRDVYEEERTPDDFGQFWSEFRSAVSSDDKEKLYALTRHEQFSWEAGEVRLHHPLCGEDGDYYFVIRSYDEFSRSYDQLFAASFKKAILTRAPVPNNQHLYTISWVERKGRYGNSYELMFSNANGRGFKFIGASMGPG